MPTINILKTYSVLWKEMVGCIGVWRHFNRYGHAIAVGDAYVFPGFLTPVLTQVFFPKPPTTFLTCFCRGERRKYAGWEEIDLSIGVTPARFEWTPTCYRCETSINANVETFLKALIPVFFSGFVWRIVGQSQTVYNGNLIIYWAPLFDTFGICF